MVYICDDLIELIYLKIDPRRTHDRLNLIKTNRHLYKKYYNTVVKMNIHKTLNRDYLGFFRFLNTFSYSNKEKSILLKGALKNTPVVWDNETCGIWDLRYIFELMYNGAYVDIQTKLSINQSVTGTMCGRITRCIFPGNRYKTMEALDRDDHLQSLHSYFVPYRKYNCKTYYRICN